MSLHRSHEHHPFAWADLHIKNISYIDLLRIYLVLHFANEHYINLYYSQLNDEDCLSAEVDIGRKIKFLQIKCVV